MISIVPLDAPVEGIRLKEEHTRAYVNNVSKGVGILYITENNIIWIDESSSEGFTLNYPDISIFAVCTDQEKYPESCVYMLIDDDDASAEEDSDSTGDNEDREEVEIRFAPLEGTNVRDLFDCIQTCNQLHPSTNDLNDSDGASDDDEDDNDMFDANEDDDSKAYANGSSENHGSFNHTNGQFDDVE